MRTCILLEAGESQGLGHLVRTGILAGALAERGHKVELHIYGDCPLAEAARFLPATDAIQVRALGPIVPDAPAAIPDCDDAPYAWVVLDGYSFSGNGWRALVRSANARLMVIDDIGNRSLEADLVLNQNLADPDIYGPGRVVADRYLIGPTYALVAGEYASIGARRIYMPNASRVLVAFGGADRLQCTTAAIKALAGSFPWMHIDAVIGPLNPLRHGIEEVAEALGRVQVHVAPTSLAPLLEAADVMVSACGSTIWQAFAAGCPAVGIMTADNQRWVAQAIAGASGDVLKPDRIDVDLPAAITRLIPRHSRSRLGTAQRKLVDGHGARRVADAMEDFLKQRSEDE